MITIDLSSKNTEIEDVRNMVSDIKDDRTLEANYRILRYVFGFKEKINEEDLEIMINDKSEKYIWDAETTEELRVVIENVRKRKMNQKEEINKSYIKISKYICLGENKTEARKSQEKAISESWNLDLCISTEF